MKSPRVLFAMLPILAVAGIAALTGCQTMIQESSNGNWIDIAPGSTLTLNQPVRVRRDRARVFFVNGRTSNSAANYRTSCALEVRRISRDGPQTIRAGTIRIKRIQNYWAEVVDIRRPDAATLRFADYGGDGDGGNQMIQTGFHLWLDDRADPNLMRLTCLGVLADPAEAYPPTVEEIRAALGGLATLEILSTTE
ncbi:MAG: hypothetical protein WBG92_25390 [Thiohalocapsa sp.]